MKISDFLEEKHGNEQYYLNVFNDLLEVKKHYPFIKILYIPTRIPTLIGCEVIAVNKSIIDITKATPNDYEGKYSKKIIVIISLNYREQGCDVYGGSWFNLELISNKSKHYYDREEFGLYKLCLGIPNEIKQSNNVILQNVKSAEHMLLEYEKMHRGDSKEYDGLAYSHGQKGVMEYEKKQRYRKI